MSRALLVIDVQLDFCAGGALAVPNGDEVVAPCNALIQQADLVVLTVDWHPPGHASFASTHQRPPFETVELAYGTQTLWPDHCVQGSPGAQLHPDLNTESARLILRKGTHPAVDSYSGFFENDRITPTGLAGTLRELGVDSVDVVGLAADYCVKYTALDALKLGFSTTVHRQATRGITAEGTEAAWSTLIAAGAILV